MNLVIVLLLALSSLFSLQRVDAAPETESNEDGPTERGRRPNIVFILTDDQDMRMKSLEYMPKVQSLLMAEGTTYMRHYAPTALCCPARVSLLTGLHAHNHKVTDVNGPNGGWKQVLEGGFNDNYLPIWLRKAGYQTYYTGKLYNGMKKHLVEEKTARGWTKADLLVGGNTYQYYDPPFQHIEGNWNNPDRINIFHGQYSTHKVAEYAYGYLREAAARDEPFFVGIAPITPHSQVGNNPQPPVPAREHRGTRPHAQVPRAENFNPPDRSGVNSVWALDQLGDRQVEILDHHYRRRTESLLTVDELVEGVIEVLRETGQLENTYIIYSSDNGFHLGHHRLGIGKKYAFEEDINVPFIVRGPGVPRGKATDIVTAHVDFAPTVLAMAGARDHPVLDGRPIPHTAEGIKKREMSAGDEHANVEFWTGATYKMHGQAKTRVNSYKSVRLAGKRYDISYTVQCHRNAHELYDMKKDPVQMRNLHPSAPAEPGGQNAFQSGNDKLAGFDTRRLLPRIDALLLVLKSCKGKSCRRPWKELHPSGDVKNLRDAMDERLDRFYETLPRVRFNRCFKDGTIDLHAEGPQWQGRERLTWSPDNPARTPPVDSPETHDRKGSGGKAAQVVMTDEKDDNDSEEEYRYDENGANPEWEGEEGYWDDWE